MKKTTIVISIPSQRQRNPLATADIMRKGGRHEKSNKAKRQKQKSETRKYIKAMQDKHSHGLFYCLAI